MKEFQVVGIGNALVDILSHVEEEFLHTNGVEKGVMTLIETERAAELYDRMGPATEVSGGSGANTIAGIAALGGRTAYVGKVKDDQLGAIFTHDIRALGATYDTPRLARDAEHETGRCMVLVTPDGERSMSTYLGASEFLSPDDIDTGMMANTEWLYLEGYRFDGPDSHEAFARAIAACRAGGGHVAITLSDPFCVERHREAFRKLIREDIDLLFANEHEILSLYQTDRLETALEAARADCRTVACTVGPRGAILLRGEDTLEVPTEAKSVVDATGAGDLFAAGFLHGVVHGRDLATCGRMGCIAAGEVIGHIGARPEADLAELFHNAGL
ncbi:MAG: adenosine kinase [Alphaproteobacteria bacterium]|nr:MAG: adenosine kinase [Alphaproteobacteria bacterium]